MDSNYKICINCDEKNDLDLPFCSNCFQADFIRNDLNKLENVKLMDNLNDDNKTILEPKSSTLRLTNKEFNIQINSGDILGREGILKDYLKNYLKISRLHVEFIFENDAWFVQDLKSTNGTFLNDTRLLTNNKVLLNNNDKLKLSSSYLINIIIE